MKLNLGSGSLKLENYVNIDIKDGKSAYPLDNIQDGSCDEIRASHLLEHFDGHQVFQVIQNWASKLKIGGILKIAVPDFYKITKAYHEGKEINVSGYILGGHTDANDYHKSIYDKRSLTDLLQSAGFKDIMLWTSEIQDCASLPISLNLQGTKALKPGKVERKVNGVMSMPRLTFTDNTSCLMTELLKNGISVKLGTGVFWGQILTNRIEEAYKDCDYILTADYDSWFRFAHVQRLLAYMELHPEADAICSMQMRRLGDIPLMGLADGQGEPAKQIEYSEFEKDILPIVTGHFGLTVFRSSVFEKLKKPWFLPIPDPNGGWDEGRTDEDIYFWRNFADSGFKAFISPKVNIAHLELVRKFPGHYSNNFKSVYVPIGNDEDIPEHCKC